MKLKKSSLLMIVAVILTLALSIGSTLAYLTDTDEHVNTMVLGNVDIEQVEVFENNSLLMPAIEDKDGNPTANDIQKEVSVKNIGKNDAYVRTVFAFEMGTMTEEEFKEYVKYAFNTAAVGAEEGKEWTAVEEHGQITIDGQNFYMMSTVRNAKLVPGEESNKTLMKVWLAPEADHAQIQAVDGNKDGELTVIVLTQGVQVNGFETAEAALNEGFQTLSKDSHPWLDKKLDGPDVDDWYNSDPNATVFEIKTAEQLTQFAKMVNNGNTFAGKTVKLTADIDLNGAAWTPIGGNVDQHPSNTFAGTFDGQNHTVSNFKATDTTANHAAAGFFGTTTGTIQNLTIDNATIISTHYAGGIVGYITDANVIENCNVTNSIIVSKTEQVDGSWDNGDKVGGIVGYANSCDIKNCSVSNTTVQGYRDLGGIVGYASGAKVSGCRVDNVAVYVDPTNNYKGYADAAAYDANAIVGENTNASVSDNKKSNVTVTFLGLVVNDANDASAIAALPAGSDVALSPALTGAVTIPAGSKDITIDANNANAKIVLADGAKDITIKNLDAAANNAGDKLITLSGNHGTVVIENSTIAGVANVKNGHAVSGGNGTTLVVDNCVIENIGYGIQDTFSGFDSLTVTNTTFKNTVSWAILNQGATKKVTIDNCTFENCQAGVLKTTGMQANGTLIFTNNTMTGRKEHNPYGLIQLGNKDTCNVTWSGNTFDGTEMANPFAN